MRQGLQTIIGITGPIGIGKSWLCESLQERFPEKISVIQTGKFVWDKFKIDKPEWNASSYQEFKMLGIMPTGRLGRLVLIDFIEGHRAENPTWLAEQIWDGIITHVRTPLVLIDAFGNRPEFEYYLRWMQRSPSVYDYMHVTIGCHMYHEGDLYPGDSRFHVDYPWAYRYHNSDEALEDISKSLRMLPYL